MITLTEKLVAAEQCEATEQLNLAAILRQKYQSILARADKPEPNDASQLRSIGRQLNIPDDVTKMLAQIVLDAKTDQARFDGLRDEEAALRATRDELTGEVATLTEHRDSLLPDEAQRNRDDLAYCAIALLTLNIRPELVYGFAVQRGWRRDGVMWRDPLASNSSFVANKEKRIVLCEGLRLAQTAVGRKFIGDLTQLFKRERNESVLNPFNPDHIRLPGELGVNV